MSKIIGRFLSAALVLCGLSMLFSPQTTQAQVSIQDAMSGPYTNNTTSLNSTSFTVSGSGIMSNEVLVLCYGSKATSGGSDAVPPSTLTWNGQTLYKTISTNGTTTSWVDGAIYYLTNPVAGSSSFSGTLPANVSFSWWLAYTITNVNTAIAPLTNALGGNGIGDGSPVSDNVNVNAGGSWAVVSATIGGTATLTISGPSGTTASTTTLIGSGSNGTGVATMGGISNCPAGLDTFSVEQGAGNKLVFLQAVFAPLYVQPQPPTITTQPASVSANAGEVVNMSVLARGTGLNYQWYVTNSSGLTPLPADNADHSGSQTATLQFLNVSASDATNYVVVVTNNFGSVTSAVATLTFSAALPAFQLRMPFTNDLGNATTLSDTTGGALNITMNMTTNGVGPADLIGAPGTGVTNLNVDAQALDLTTNIIWSTANYNNGNTIAEPVANDINDTTLTNLGNNGIIGPFTVSFWMNQQVQYSSGGASPRLWILNGGSTAQGENGSAANMALYLNNGLQSSEQLEFTYGVAAVSLGGDTGANLPVNQWLYVAVTYDGTTFRMYYTTATNTVTQNVTATNTVTQIGSAVLPGQSISLGSTACLSIGNRSIDFHRGFDGLIEDFRFYNVCASTNLLNEIVAQVGAPPPIPPEPEILSQSPSLELYSNSTAVFSITAQGQPPLNYQWWFTNLNNVGTELTDGNGILGSTNSVLTISNITTADDGNYFCMISNSNTNGYQTTNSTAVSLTIVSPGGAYEKAAAADGPLHYYAFNDTGNPSTGTELAYDFEGGDNGIYGSEVQNGYDSIYGPTSANGFPGFSTTNYAASFDSQIEPDAVTLKSPWQLNTNTVTITGWLYSEGQDGSAGIVMNRGSGNDVEGLAMTPSGNQDLGYTWNDDTNTVGWDSGLTLPTYQWTFVALVVTPTSATIHMMNASGISSSTYFHPHAVAAFSGATTIGDDNNNPINHNGGQMTFDGSIDEMGVYNQALTRPQLESLFTNASGEMVFPPTNSVVLVTPSPFYPGMTAQFSTTFLGGSDPMSYMWQLNGTNLTDGANGVGIISGSATSSLTITNLAIGDAGKSYNLTLVMSNSDGVYTSSVPAMLTVLAPSGPTNIYTLGNEPSGQDWNTATNWSDGNPASLSAYSEPGSTYQIAINTLERTPLSSNASFPGDKLQVLGNGVLVNDGGVNTGELRLKQSGSTSVTNYGTIYTNGGTINFPDLQLMGGQIDNGGSSVVTLTGQIDVLSNSAVYVDSGAESIGSCQINALLTGTGTLTYSEFSTIFTNNDLIVSGAGNTFCGQWNILQGTLLGTVADSLGTNTITVNTGGAVETLYNLDDTNAALVLNGGQMFLHQNDQFASVTVNGTHLANGTYSFAALNSAYPASFPASWTQQIGSTFTAGSGEIIVGNVVSPPSSPKITHISLSGTSLSIMATNGSAGGSWELLQSTNVALPLNQWQTNVTGVFDGSGNLSTNIVNTATNHAEFYVLKMQ